MLSVAVVVRRASGGLAVGRTTLSATDLGPEQSNSGRATLDLTLFSASAALRVHHVHHGDAVQLQGRSTY